MSQSLEEISRQNKNLEIASYLLGRSESPFDWSQMPKEVLDCLGGKKLSRRQMGDKGIEMIADVLKCFFKPLGEELSEEDKQRYDKLRLDIKKNLAGFINDSIFRNRELTKIFDILNDELCFDTASLSHYQKIIESSFGSKTKRHTDMELKVFLHDLVTKNITLEEVLQNTSSEDVAEEPSHDILTLRQARDKDYRASESGGGSKEERSKEITCFGLLRLTSGCFGRKDDVMQQEASTHDGYVSMRRVTSSVSLGSQDGGPSTGVSTRDHTTSLSSRTPQKTRSSRSI